MSTLDRLNKAASRAGRFVQKPSAALAVLILAAGATFAGHASAASFKCTSHSSASEKIVCQDPTLSALDDRLAESYRHAQETSLDPRALESARTEQWLWRQHNCTVQACVQSWYERRIAELDADYQHAKQERHDAFEASLAAQKLNPSAADEVRRIKDVPVAATQPVTTEAAAK